MVLVGRITKDAVVNRIKNDREVVNFTVALNDWYKPKDSDESVKTTTFITCAYWMSPKIAPRLLKGALVEVSGRIYADAYIGVDSEARATIHCHVNTIKIHGSPKEATREKGTTQKKAPVQHDPAGATDDLPF